MSRKGRITDGQVEGSIFYAGSKLFCASGPSRRRTFSHFSDVEFLDKGLTTLTYDQNLVVSPSVRDEYSYFVNVDYTYEVLAVMDGGVLRWKWRKWASGMFPSGTYSDVFPLTTDAVELEYGVTITFSTTTGKQHGDLWRFDALTMSPFLVKGIHVSDKTVTCPLPQPDPSYPDADPGREGLQQELKLSMRGDTCFSVPTYVDKDMRRSVTGDPKHLANVTEELKFDEDIKLYTEGYFSGPEEYTFEIQMISSTMFKWRKYRLGESVCKTSVEGPWCRFKGTGTVSVNHAVHLEHGVFVKFATLTGKQAGDRWTFDAYTFWSTTYSPVLFVPNGQTSPDDALLYVDGTFTGTEGDMTYEVEVSADTGTFRWRKYPSTSTGASASWHEEYYIGTQPVQLDHGVSVYWLTFEGKHHGDRWKFTAYSGHLITWLTKSYVGDPLPAQKNVDGDARAPTVSGVYHGHEIARLRIEIGGPCTTSCTEFRWKKEYPAIQSPYQPTQWEGGKFTSLIEMESHDQRLTDGINITWGPTSGYKHGNTYIITLVPMSTSILPVRPLPSPYFSPLGLRSTYQDNKGVAPARNSVITVEFISSTTFKWRKDTGPYSAPKAVIVDEPMTVGNGVNLTFASSSGFTPGLQYLIPLRTHIPHVVNVTTAHNGARLSPTISQPVAASSNYANFPNQGSLLSDVRPWGKNKGNHSITAYPAAGTISGGASAVPGSGLAHQRGVGLSNVINAVATQGYLVAKYPTTYIKIIGAPAISEITGALADELAVSGIYSGLSSYVYQVEPHLSSSLFRWRKYPLGLSDANATEWETNHAIVVTGATSLDSNLSVTFQSPSYSTSATNRWTFTANSGHSFVHRDVGRASWSDEKLITGQPQQLSAGISVQFSQLSGYTPGKLLAQFSPPIQFSSGVGTPIRT